MIKMLSGLFGVASDAISRLATPLGQPATVDAAGAGATAFDATLAALLAPGEPTGGEGDATAADGENADRTLGPTDDLLAMLRTVDVTSPTGPAVAEAVPPVAGGLIPEAALAEPAVHHPTGEVEATAPAAHEWASPAPLAPAPPLDVPVPATLEDHHAAQQAEAVAGHVAPVVLAPIAPTVDAPRARPATDDALPSAASPPVRPEPVPAASASGPVERTVVDRLLPGTGTPVPAPARPRDPRRVERAMALLEPEFRGRLERVIERMRTEYGHEVRVVETYRDPARQEHLFAQGRTRPGPVVTWTRNSKHSHGVAADLIVDGSYENPEGFARLARVAEAEGLSTLGPRDPGHVELPGTRPRGAWSPMIGGAQGMAAEATRAVPHAGVSFAPERVQPPVEFAATDRFARPARVAEVAQVAAVAQVAQVAQVAAPARVAQVARVAGPGAPLLRNEGVAPRPARQESEPVDRSLVEELPTTLAAGGEPGAPATSPSRAPAAEGVRPAMGAEAMDRVARVLELRDAAAARPLSQMVLRVENAQGTVDHIRIGVRGGAVDTTIDLGNRAELDPLTNRAPELQRALERHGLEAESVRVRSTPANVEVSELARVAAALADGDALRTSSTRSGSSDSLPQRDRQQAPDRDTAQDRADDPRHRSRREHKGGKHS